MGTSRCVNELARASAIPQLLAIVHDTNVGHAPYYEGLQNDLIMTAPTCPKCSIDMEEGFMIDHAYGERLSAEWIEGKPVKSFWTGVKVPTGANHPVVTYRCTRCGYLDSYALPA